MMCFAVPTDALLKLSVRMLGSAPSLMAASMGSNMATPAITRRCGHTIINHTITCKQSHLHGTKPDGIICKPTQQPRPYVQQLVLESISLQDTNKGVMPCLLCIHLLAASSQALGCLVPLAG